MGVDITTYRSRIGSYKHTCVQDVVTITCFGSFNSGDLKTTGSVVFIGLLLLIAGIESNPGPNEIKRIILTIAISLLACVYFQRLEHVLYTVCLLIVVNIFCAVNVEEIGTRTNADHEHMIGADVPQNATPSGHDNEDISENSRNGQNGVAAFETEREETATGEDCLSSEGDIAEFDKGSDEIVTNASKPMSEEERKSIELLWKDKDFKQCVIDKNYGKILDKKIVQWQQEDVYVAVVGRTGVGKSRFTNAFRGCTSKEDPLYAPVGSVETTKEAKAYPHPKNPRLILWDLPGIGTDSFRRDDYVKDKKINFTNYHIYLIMASDRFTQDELFLAKEIEKIGKKFLFVRTRVDINLDDVADEKDEIRKIREDCSKSLTKGKFKSNEVYLISSKYVNHKYLDFAKLLERLVLSLEGVKKEVILYSLQFNTKLFIESKASALQLRIHYVSLKSAVIGSIPFPGLSLVVDTILISKELDFYRETLGVTTSDLIKLAVKTNKDVDDLIAEYKLKTFCKPTADTSSFGAKYGTIMRRIALSEAVKSTSILVPVVGSVVAAGVSYGTTYHFLKSYLDMMVEDARKMLSILLEETGSTVLPLNPK